MKRCKGYKIQKESLEDMRESGRFNRCIEITFKDLAGEHTHKIGAGYSDEIDVYQEESVTFLLSHNPGLGYFGLEMFEGDEKVGDLFIDSHQVKDTIGREDLSPFNTIKRMAEYIQ